MSIIRQKEKVVQASLSLLLVLAMLLLAREQVKRFVTTVFAQESSTTVIDSKELPPLPPNTNLFFVSVDSPALLSAVAHDSKEPIQNIQRLEQWIPFVEKLPEPSDAPAHDGAVVAGELFPSPDGRKIAIQVYYGTDPATWLLDLQDRDRPQLKHLANEGLTIFVGWHPDGQQALVRAENIGVPDPGLWIVNSNDGTHQMVEIPELVAPEGLLAATFAPDGQTLLYATSKGLGFGSELWSVGVKGENRHLLWKDEFTTVSSILWSPDGEHVAFTNILDAPIPFAEAGLWHMQRDGSEQKQLAVMDGGRGQNRCGATIANNCTSLLGKILMMWMLITNQKS